MSSYCYQHNLHSITSVLEWLISTAHYLSTSIPCILHPTFHVLYAFISIAYIGSGLDALTQGQINILLTF